MKVQSPQLQELIEAAHALINANRAQPRQKVEGLAQLWIKLAQYEASELHKPAHMHAIASEQTDDLQEVAK